MVLSDVQLKVEQFQGENTPYSPSADACKLDYICVQEISSIQMSERDLFSKCFSVQDDMLTAYGSSADCQLCNFWRPLALPLHIHACLTVHVSNGEYLDCKPV